MQGTQTSREPLPQQKGLEPPVREHTVDTAKLVSAFRNGQRWESAWKRLIVVDPVAAHASVRPG